MKKPKTKTINTLLMNGGVGDHVSSFTVIDYIARKYSYIKQMVWMPDLLLDLAKAVIERENVELYSYSQMRFRYDPEKPTKSTQWDQITSPLRIHCMDYAFLKLADEMPPMDQKNYLKLRGPIDLSAIEGIGALKERYVVITTGFTAEVREFRPEFINKLVQYVKSKGYQAVFLGQTVSSTGSMYKIKATFKEEIKFGEGLNLVDKTTLSQAASLMANARVVLGVDNGLIHVAGLTDTAIVAGYPTVPPNVRVPIRHGLLGWNCMSVIPDDALECRFCQYGTNFLYGHNYTQCLHEEGPLRLACLSQLSAGKFIEKLEYIL